MSDLRHALDCFRIYHYPTDFQRVFNNGSVCFGYNLIDGVPEFSGRGTDDRLDLIHDVESMIMIDHTVLGKVPAGFVAGFDDMVSTILTAFPSIAKSTLIRVKGHSLGASHGFYLGKLFRSLGVAVEGIFLGLPHSGSNNDAGYVIRAYRDNSDPVTSVPPEAPQIEQIPISVATISFDPWGLARDHRIHYYCIAMALLEEKTNGQVIGS